MRFFKTNLLVLLLLPVLKPAAQQGIRVSLVANNKEKLTVYQDEPLSLSLFLSNPAAAANGQWNREALLGIAQLEKQLATGRIDTVLFQQEKQRLQAGMKQDNNIIIGSDAAPLAQQVRLVLSRKNGDTFFVPAKCLSGDSVKQVVLDANAVNLLEWGVNRAAMRRIKPGIYELTATVEGYHSNTVQLSVRPKSIPASLLQTVTVQSSLGRFALRYGYADSALYHARNILKGEPSSIEGWTLLGEAFIRKDQFAHALNAFETALQIFRRRYPHSPEPPEYILGSIAWLKEK